MNYLLVFLAMVPSVTLARSPSCEISAAKIFFQVLANAEAKKEDGLFLDQERLLRALMSDISPDGTDYIARLSQIYLGESVGEVLSEVVTRRGDVIIPLLSKDRCKESIDLYCMTRSNKSVCRDSLRCVENFERSDRLISLIKKKKVFQSEEKPLRALNEKERCSLMKSLK